VLASVPAARFGAVRVSRAGILLAAASLAMIAVAARALWSLVAILVLGAAANSMGQLSSNVALSRYVPARRQGLSFRVKQAAVARGIAPRIGRPIAHPR
jgi:hypothetical protein